VSFTAGRFTGNNGRLLLPTVVVVLEDGRGGAVVVGDGGVRGGRPRRHVVPPPVAVLGVEEQVQGLARRDHDVFHRERLGVARVDGHDGEAVPRDAEEHVGVDHAEQVRLSPLHAHLEGPIIVVIGGAEVVQVVAGPPVDGVDVRRLDVAAGAHGVDQELVHVVVAPPLAKDDGRHLLLHHLLPLLLGVVGVDDEPAVRVPSSSDRMTR
jgi:hypothetical protein